MNTNPYNNGYPQGGGYPQQPHQQPYQPPQYAQPQYQPLTQEQLQMQQEYARRLQIKRAQSAEQSQILTAGIVLGGTLIASLIIQVIFVIFIQVRGLMDTFNTSFAFQHAFNILVVDIFGLLLPYSIAYLVLKKHFVTPLVPTKKVGFLKGAAWVFFGLAVCFCANYLTSFVMALFKNFGYELSQPESLKPVTAFDCVLMVFSTAIAPAVCEEFAMRCASLGALRRHGKAFAVVAVSIIFGLMHGNVIQFVFAFTIGLALGYITIRTDSVVPAMFIHGLNNGLSVIQYTLMTGMAEKTAESITTFIMIGYFVLGIGGLIYLVATHSFLPEKEPEQPKPYKISFGKKLLLLLPGLLLPILILLGLTNQYITKI